MAGGVGSRFWPMSTEKRPKQFLDVLGLGKSLIRLTYERFAKICPAQNILVVTNAQYTGLVQAQIPELEDWQILGEPIGRNTAPCILYAAEKIAKRDPNAVMVVAPSDHVIQNEDVFVEVTAKALDYAATRDVLITLGIKPSRPDTGYGYIHYDLDTGHNGFNKVKSFTEKPLLHVAESFLASGDYLWNAGIFVWSAKSISRAFERYLPRLGRQFADIRDKLDSPEETPSVALVYADCEGISVDYGIMEKARNVEVYPAPFLWSDVGTWNALFELKDKDANGNVVAGKKLLMRNVHDSLVMVQDQKLVALNGISGLMVIESDDALLIADLNDEQAVKELVQALKQGEYKSFI
jgi:mannose-1-phosphate guanylyltransferase